MIEVQEKIKKKEEQFKAWQRGGNEDLRKAYKEVHLETKKVVAKAKEEAWSDWYDKMEIEGGERMICI